MKQQTVSGSGISWAVCKSAPRSRQITTPAPHHSVFLQARCPSCRPTNSIKALKANCTVYVIMYICVPESWVYPTMCSMAQGHKNSPAFLWKNGITYIYQTAGSVLKPNFCMLTNTKTQLRHTWSSYLITLH